MAQTECIIGSNSGLLNVMKRVNLVASKNIPVLLHGETGTGKEVIAQLIHEQSMQRNGVLKRVNCGAIPHELIDSELFGHEKGAFTGTSGTHRGWFEQANNGSLLLDEVGELSQGAQVRLLRVLQDGTFTRVGGEKKIQTNVRVIAATHRNLPEMIAQKQFREDLYYRLSVFPIVLPPLRDRQEDIVDFANYFIERAVVKFGVRPMVISTHDIALLQSYSWPGNIREFASVMDRAVLLGETTGVLNLSQALGSSFSESLLSPVESETVIQNSDNNTLDAVIRRHIQKVVGECHGRIEGPFGAAKRLGINPSTLRSKMRKLSIASRS